MKRTLLFVLVVCLAVRSRAQVVMNELNVSGEHQYLELYNPGIVPAGANLNCYTLITYFKNAAEQGFYVLTMPHLVIAPQGFALVSSADQLQLPTGAVLHTDVNWNRLGPDAAFKKYIFQTNAKGQISYQLKDVPADFSELFSWKGNKDRVVLLYEGTSLVDAFVASDRNNDLPGSVKQMPDLDFSNACGNALTVSFNSLYTMYPSVFEHVNGFSESDYGYVRGGNGGCSNWKTVSSVNEFTPGITNVSYAGKGYDLVTNFNGSQGTLSYLINRSTATSGTFSVRLYIDNPPFGVLSPNDVEYSQSPVNYTNAGTSIRGYFRNIASSYVILVIDAPDVCQDIVRPVNGGASETPLSASVQGFDISRNNAMVQIAWETITEQNNRGFEVQRRNPGEDWTTVAYVATVAPAGTSNRTIDYLYGDRNPLGGTSEYRLKQVDVTGTSVYSEIKTVPGLNGYDGLTVYPNPSTDGRLNILFDDINTLRDVQVININGQVVQQWRSINNHQQQINNLLPGEYVVRVQDQLSGMVTSKKVIVGR